jgi:hypothetical protein
MVGKAMSEPPESDANGWLRGEVLGSVSLMLTKSPEKLVDMICAYGSEVNADDILDNGTDEQILLAFTRIMRSCVPFFFDTRDFDGDAEGSECFTGVEVYELVLSEWHVPPEQILDSWTEEKFLLILKKAQRKNQAHAACSRAKD